MFIIKKSTMRIHFPTFLLLIIILGINATAICQDKKWTVVSSASIFQDMTRIIGGNLVDAKTIVPIGSDPHLYDPTPRDARLVQNADLIFINGLTFEGWIEDLVANSGTSAKMVRITEGAAAITSEKYKNAADPHVWMDASNGLIYIQNIRDALINLDPENASVYEQNHDNYAQKIKDLDRYIENEIQKIPEKQRVLITSHDAFAYYGKRYGLTLNAIMGISTEAEAQTSDIIRVSKAIKESKVPAIFVESTINPKLLKQIAEDNDVQIGGELYADSLGPEGSEGDTYLKMLRHNTDVIVKALSQVKNEEDRPSDSNGTPPLWLYTILAFIFLAAIITSIIKFK
jgi:ABC-type Zn uptake system ZnuABC Zn-binding protein ZnuA